MYYNTNNETGNELKRSRRQTNRQEDYVLSFFQSNPGEFAPSEVAEEFPDWPLTSVRRAITNLTKAGLLAKTKGMFIGPYGKKEHTWTLSENDNETKTVATIDPRYDHLFRGMR